MPKYDSATGSCGSASPHHARQLYGSGMSSGLGSGTSMKPERSLAAGPRRVKRVQRSMSFIGLARNRPHREDLQVSSGPVSLHLRISPECGGPPEAASSSSSSPHVSVSLLVAMSPLEDISDASEEPSLAPPLWLGGLEASRDAITGKLIRREGSDSQGRPLGLPAYLPSINSVAVSSGVATNASRTTNNSFRAWATVVTRASSTASGGGSGVYKFPSQKALEVTDHDVCQIMTNTLHLSTGLEGCPVCL